MRRFFAVFAAQNDGALDVDFFTASERSEGSGWGEGALKFLLRAPRPHRSLAHARDDNGVVKSEWMFENFLDLVPRPMKIESLSAPALTSWQDELVHPL